MTQLTKDELSTIARNPLNNWLNEVRDGLRDAERANRGDTDDTDVASDDNTAAPGLPKVYALAVSRLFAILSASEVAISLASRTGKLETPYSLT